MPLHTEEKWKINREKVAHAKSIVRFVNVKKEGLILKTIPIENHNLVVCVFDNHTFTVNRPALLENPKAVLALVYTLEKVWHDIYPEFFELFHQLAKDDEAATRKAKMQKILAAIANNMDDIPGLKEEVIKTWTDAGTRRGHQSLLWT